MRNAHYLAKQAEEKGIIVNPGKCETCGNSEKELVKHHRDYSKPLEVTWLCPPCHSMEHRRNKELKDPCGEAIRASAKKKRKNASIRFMALKH